MKRLIFIAFLLGSVVAMAQDKSASFTFNATDIATDTTVTVSYFNGFERYVTYKVVVYNTHKQDGTIWCGGGYNDVSTTDFNYFSDDFPITVDTSGTSFQPNSDTTTYSFTAYISECPFNKVMVKYDPGTDTTAIVKVYVKIGTKN